MENNSKFRKKCEDGGENGGTWEPESRGAAVAVIGNGKSGDLTHFTYLLE